MKGRWRSFYRAIDKDGATLDFYLSERRNATAAGRFLGAALKRSREWVPRVISTDKNPAYGEAIAALKKNRPIPQQVEHRRSKYLNNRIESDHGQLKSMRTAHATIAGFELMRMFRGQRMRRWGKERPPVRHRRPSSSDTSRATAAT